MRLARRVTCLLLVTSFLQACGGGRDPAAAAPSATTTLSAGQVAGTAANAKVTHYAASRFAEQVSFGPTPALVAEVRAKGFEAWIDEQMAMPMVPIDLAPAEEIYKYPHNVSIPETINAYYGNEFMRLALTAPDQLRWRMQWSLSQFIVAARTMSEIPGQVVWANVLYSHAFGNYSSLLRAVSLDPYMGNYLNNAQNRPKSAECPHCAPNENYARELMQLFSIGVVLLEPDGTPRRDSRGKFIETYTQEDVEELARALTGWTIDPVPQNRPQRNYGNWSKPMVPTTWPPERDAGRKVVMGTEFPAGQKQDKDLDNIIAMLMAHPNIAPFVALRMIQNLVKSDPSPAYVGRIAAKFRNNGAGVAGDMKAVVKAVLLDGEARRGDNPVNTRPEDGKFREPWLHRTALFRGMGCQRNPEWESQTHYYTVHTQEPNRADSVFGFYAPTDRAPGSNLLAPEQRLLDAREMTARLSEANGLRWNRAARVNDMAPLRGAGCSADLFVDAFSRSPKDFLDMLSERYFRGAMPPTLRNNMEQMIKAPNWNANDMSEGAMRMLDFALTTPYYGVIK